MNAWIQVRSGGKFHPLNPQRDEIHIEDIAFALSNICRFGGHCPFYSVAEHSVRVSYLLTGDDALTGLLHDGSEAYLGDVPRPLKRSGPFEEYREAEYTLQQMIYERFECAPESGAVKDADAVLLATEARDLMGPLQAEWAEWMATTAPLPQRIEPWTPDTARSMFMARFIELTGNVVQDADTVLARSDD